MANETRPEKRRRIDGDIITLVVGAEVRDEKTTPITIHESLLRDKSPFFQAALSKCWKESQEKVINMPEDEPQILFSYRDFLYTGTVDSSQASPMKDWHDEEVEEEYLFLAKICVFAEKVQDKSFFNTATRRFVEIVNFDIRGDGTVYPVPSHNVIKTIYDGTPEGSPARNLVLDAFQANADRSWLEGAERSKALQCPEFLCDLTLLLMPQEDISYSSALDPDDGRYLWK